MRYIHIPILFLLIFNSLAVNASEPVNVSRYLVVDPSVENEKLWPMETVISFSAKEYPNIKSAIEFLLTHIGYRLHGSVLEQPYISILKNSVPPIHAEFEKNSIKEIIHALMGPGFNIHVDPVSRIVAFKVDSKFITGDK